MSTHTPGPWVTKRDLRGEALAQVLQENAAAAEALAEKSGNGPSYVVEALRTFAVNDRLHAAAIRARAKGETK